MTETIEVHLDVQGNTRQIAICRYVSKPGGSASSLYQYRDDWLNDSNAFVPV